VGGETGRKETTRKTEAYIGDNIEMDLCCILWDYVDWIYLVQNVDMWWAAVGNLRVL
jgi:hypothetical protein